MKGGRQARPTTRGAQCGAGAGAFPVKTAPSPLLLSPSQKKFSSGRAGSPRPCLAAGRQGHTAGQRVCRKSKKCLEIAQSQAVATRLEVDADLRPDGRGAGGDGRSQGCMTRCRTGGGTLSGELAFCLPEEPVGAYPVYRTMAASGRAHGAFGAGLPSGGGFGPDSREAGRHEVQPGTSPARGFPGREGRCHAGVSARRTSAPSGVPVRRREPRGSAPRSLGPPVGRRLQKRPSMRRAFAFPMGRTGFRDCPREGGRHAAAGEHDVPSEKMRRGKGTLSYGCDRMARTAMPVDDAESCGQRQPVDNGLLPCCRAGCGFCG